MSYELRFVETEYGSYHPAQGTYVDGFVVKNIDSEKTAGNSYFEVESRKCTIEFYITDWVQTNIIDNFENFENTQYHSYCFQIIKDNELYYVGYIKKTDISIDKRKSWVKITGTNILGVLLKLAETKKEYDVQYYDIIPVIEDTGILPDEIEDIISNFNINVSDDFSTMPGLDVENMKINYDHENEFLDNSGTEGFVGSGISYSRRTREITWDVTEHKFRVVLIDYTSQNNGSWWTSTFIIIRFYISTKGDITDIYFRNRTSQVETNYYDYWVSNGGNNYSNIYSATYQSWTITVTGRKVYYTGNLGLIGITIKPDNEGDTTKFISRKDMIVKCLKLINGYLYVTPNSIVIKNRYPIDTSNSIAIINGIKDFVSTGFLCSLNFIGDFNNFENANYLESIMELFYSHTFITFNKEYDVDLDSVINTVSIEDVIFIYDTYMKIVDIVNPPNSDIYYIKAWGE